MTDPRSSLVYKGLSATFGFDPDDLVFTGRIAGINDVVGFHSESVAGLVEAFHEAVDDYLETCDRLGKEAERPYSGKVMLRVDPSVHAQIALAAQLSGRSMNDLGEEALRALAERMLPEKLLA